MEFIYKGLEAEFDRHIVTDGEVDTQMERLRQQTPNVKIITDRAAQNGDELLLDYAGFCDGEQFAGGTAENQTLVLGSGMFIPGFEEQLVDKVPGEKVIVKVTFPEQYHADNLAGKEVEFHCTIHQIRLKMAYELDDTFAKEVGGCDSFEDMREKMRVSMQAYTDERGEMDLQDRLLRQAADTLDFQPSDSQIEAELDTQMQNMAAQLAHQGLNLQMYCQFMNTTEEKLRQDARPDAVASIKIQAAIEQIVALEGLTAEKEEIAEAMALVCRQNNMTLEQLKPYYDAEFEAALVRSVLTTKTMKLIRDNAVITAAE